MRGAHLMIAGALLLAACDGGAQARIEAVRARFDDEELARMLRASPLPAPPADPTNAVADDPRAAALGERLFFDARLSGNGEVSCATCHDPEHGWADGRAKARGIAALDLHTPSVRDGAFDRWHFWDGRADSLWAQALQPLEHPDEQGGNRVAIARLVAEDPAYRTGYERLFGALPELDDPARFPTDARPVAGAPDHPQQRAWDAMAPEDRTAVDRAFANVGKLIAAFERTLLSGETPFDRFVRGLSTGDADDLAALDEDQLAGARLFFGDARCHLCHHGPTFSDLEFHDVRLPVEDEPVLAGRHAGIAAVLTDPFNGLGEFSDAPGDQARTQLAYLDRNPHTLGEFKTPGLRDVANTGPYMHTGQFKTLDEVVAHYSELADAPEKRHVDAGDVLVPALLTAAEQRSLVAFLTSLTPDPSLVSTGNALAPSPPQESPE